VAIDSTILVRYFPFLDAPAPVLSSFFFWRSPLPLSAVTVWTALPRRPRSSLFFLFLFSVLSQVPPPLPGPHADSLEYVRLGPGGCNQTARRRRSSLRTRAHPVALVAFFLRSCPPVSVGVFLRPPHAPPWRLPLFPLEFPSKAGVPDLGRKPSDPPLCTFCSCRRAFALFISLLLRTSCQRVAPRGHASHAIRWIFPPSKGLFGRFSVAPLLSVVFVPIETLSFFFSHLFSALSYRTHEAMFLAISFLSVLLFRSHPIATPRWRPAGFPGRCHLWRLCPSLGLCTSMCFLETLKWVAISVFSRGADR